MKKKLSAIVLVLFCFFPSFVKAESGIENFYVNAVLENDGDLVVEEYFYLNGEFNGMDRDILFRNPDAYEFRSELEYYGGSKIHNGSDIILEEIRALPIDENFTFQNISGTLFKKVSNADAGDYGVYTVTTSLDGESYRIFLPDSKNEAFYLKYTLKNMAVVHDDVAEIFWNVIGNDLRESIGNLKVTITFPNNKNEFRVWAHGPLQGKINKVSNQVLEAQVKNVRSYKAVDIRAVFDKSVVPFSTKYTNVVALEKILNYEEDMANQANYEREQKEYQNQENAYAEISYCEERLSRSCYESAKRSVNLVTDLNVKADLQERLAELLVLIVAREEENARNYTSDALLYRDYYWYEKAIEAVNILENKELKETLLQQLESVRQEIMLVEEAYNKKAIGVNIFLFIVLGLLAVILYIKCDKEIKVDFSHKYMRDFPDDLAPSTVEYLFKKEISDKAVSSEILYLICQKKIFFKQMEDKKDFLLQKNPEWEGRLSEKEQALVDFLFLSSNSITLKKLKNRNSYSSVKKWNSLQEEMSEEALQEELYIDEERKIFFKAKKNMLSSFLIAIFVFVFLLNVDFSPVVVIFVFVLIFLDKNGGKISLPKKKNFDFYLKRGSRIFLGLVVIFCIWGIIQLYAMNHFVFSSRNFYIAVLFFAILLFWYIGMIRKRTEKGAVAFAKWKAFKRFLKDFGRMDEKELPEIVLWEKYLVYAVVFGCASKLAKSMQIKMQDMNVLAPDFIDPFVLTHFNFVSSTITSSVRSARSYTSPTSSSGGNWSSGSGGGGGFSSGGGSGGGGGGGGRF